MSDRSERETLTAENLRQSINKKKTRRAEEAATRRNAADVQMEEMFKEFLNESISQAELDEIRSRIIRATEREEYEVEIMRFPAKLCLDNGRAINNIKSDWPQTLPGKAKDFFEFFTERGKTQGFKLTAKIIDFPNGMPGNVGLSVSWD